MRSTPATTVGGNLGDLPESNTRHSKIPVESGSSESISSRSLGVVTSSNVVTLNWLPSAPRPSAFLTSTNSSPSQYLSRHASGRPMPCPSAHQYTSMRLVLIGWLHSYSTHC